jgi:glutathione S-transferase
MRNHKMIIVHHLNESRSHRILWLLEELDIPYQIQPYQRDIHTRMAPPELKAVHPLGKSPVISEDGRVIAESGAIIDYIIRRHGFGQLEPDRVSEDYDEYVHWLHYAEGSAVVPFIVQPIARTFGKHAAPLARHVDEEIHLHMGYIDGRLKDKQYLLGDSLTGADIQLSFVGELAGTRIDRSIYPNLDAWVRRFQARDAYRAAIERGGPYNLGGSSGKTEN